MGQITTVQITCGQCGHKFVLNTSTWPSTIQCPYCLETMAEDMIPSVKEAWGTVSDLNMDFVKYHSDRGEPQFSVDLVAEQVHFPHE